MFPFSDASLHHRTFPYVNSGLVGISVLVFLYEMYLGGFGTLTGKGDLDLDIFFLKWGFISQELTSGNEFSRFGPIGTSGPMLPLVYPCQVTVALGCTVCIL